MKFMFEAYSNSKKLNISLFNTKKFNAILIVDYILKDILKNNMICLVHNKYNKITRSFEKWKIIVYLNIYNFKLDIPLYNGFIFSFCSKELKDKVRNQIILKKEAFYYVWTFLDL